MVDPYPALAVPPSAADTLVALVPVLDQAAPYLPAAATSTLTPAHLHQNTVLGADSANYRPRGQDVNCLEVGPQDSLLCSPMDQT